MTNFMYMQSIVNYRIPIKEDGSLGQPEVESKWTTERHKPKKKKTNKVKLFTPEKSGEVYL